MQCKQVVSRGTQTQAVDCTHADGLEVHALKLPSSKRYFKDKTSGIYFDRQDLELFDTCAKNSVCALAVNELTQDKFSASQGIPKTSRDSFTQVSSGSKHLEEGSTMTSSHMSKLYINALSADRTKHVQFGE